MSDGGWSEEDSALYARIAPIAVPDRAEQMAVLATLIPYGPKDRFRIVELASGQGRLAHALLRLFPEAELLALDGSSEMRDATAASVEPFGGRAKVEDFDLLDLGWLDRIDGAGLVTCSLSVHHLDADEKQQLFREVAARLTPGGALLLADIVLPQRPEATEIAAASWDETARAQAEERGEPDLYDSFADAQWNLFRYPDPGFDKPSPLAHQLAWLSEAGFVDVDCFWLRAGHAVYGGYVAGGAPGERLSYEQALGVARDALR